MSGIPNLKDLVFRDTPFANLMNKRIYNVLLIATKYDSFMLEDDGRVDEQIFNEYTSLSLRYPPRFTQVTTEEEALNELKNRNFELIICMPNMDNRDIFAAASEIKVHYPNIPIVVLTPFSKEVLRTIRPAWAYRSSCWWRIPFVSIRPLCLIYISSCWSRAKCSRRRR